MALPSRGGQSSEAEGVDGHGAGWARAADIFLLSVAQGQGRLAREANVWSTAAIWRGGWLGFLICFPFRRWVQVCSNHARA